MISFAVLGLLQALFIPGFLVASALFRFTRLALADRMLIATPLSLVLNYVLVSGLVIAHAYNRAVMLLIIVAELVAVIAVTYRNPPSTVQAWSSEDGRADTSSPVERHLICIFKVLALALLLTLYRKTFGSVFVEWDPVVTWNRWAKNWFGQSVEGSWGYPPGVPILFSIVYKLGGTTNVQTVAKLVTDYFPFFGLFCFWRLAHLRKEFALTFAIAGMAFAYLLAFGMGFGFAFSGYVDPVMAALGAFIIYALAFSIELAKSEQIYRQGKHVIALLAISAASIGLVKQSGVVVALMYALIVASRLRWLRGKELRYSAAIAGLFLVMVGHWYLFSYLRWNDFFRAEELIKVPFHHRPYAGFQMLTAAVGLIPVMIALGSILFSRAARRIFVFLVLPLFLFWALLVSYDLRTAFVYFPWLALLAGISLGKISQMKPAGPWALVAILYLLLSESSRIHGESFSLQQFGYTCAVIYLLYFAASAGLRSYSGHFSSLSPVVWTTSLMGILAIFLLCLPSVRSSERILAENTFKRIQSNDKGFNSKLSALFKQDPDAKMISCWQMVYNIPATEGRFIPSGACNSLPEEWLARPDVNYFLYWSAPGTSQPEQTRELLRSKGVRFSEETLADGYILFKKL